MEGYRQNPPAEIVNSTGTSQATDRNYLLVSILTVLEHGRPQAKPLDDIVTVLEHGRSQTIPSHRYTVLVVLATGKN